MHYIAKQKKYMYSYDVTNDYVVKNKHLTFFFSVLIISSNEIVSNPHICTFLLECKNDL